ncbi:hypothetical protein A3A93_04520 [Candidatus Roizmanbacteria bacterium RIFCSPLOWO2_01_FULL_38_12]|uniref:Uncharacterized protein n=1 Tax=Candidatus Roizmanbacteria bacterium RIFCSPLOWO2_01_FULL_38_12 TaxID=1802061 RepID=A0A1F7IVS0_9BACT|nr:MAG: hypothetical protein A2861_00295 [Candidatus Roizmanbacteria bacterium RIFCSPHIGHO2_01_FULL_38_15]OGK36135.1 MAG: hypothetical protein A3F59_01540 [Candidatus Roizmanbacteria bacterium RIFCSPHIGHO2_12_FULL_38_13]OGK47468.1 MAG: hypothetical protein A3A93_04520 [Candidatus Roizmanbacteria bacterium RIFCSPLOWO2_01_FULL_38_12]
MKNNPQPQPFWSGFSLGLLGGSLVMYFIATKKGRELLHKVADHSESLESNIEHVLKALQKNVLHDKDDNA